MADLKILEAEGWQELPLRSVDQDITEIWEAAAVGDLQTIERHLVEYGLLADDEELQGFKLFAVPDDILHEYYRAWVKTRTAGSSKNPGEITFEDQLGRWHLFVRSVNGAHEFTLTNDETGEVLRGSEPGPLSNARAAARRLIMRHESRNPAAIKRRMLGLGSYGS
jgi:hypothetical protein